MIGENHDLIGYARAIEFICLVTNMFAVRHLFIVFNLVAYPLLKIIITI